ncbi:transcriptional regulator [Marinobacterium aestuarii]|uniref:Transcriptional regulator n=1 Tax=Marinobacterium aestuarii TaxID=1821621 RepID=A0A1A9F055_9GAMM|nr:ChrR family anti-sigma-E factor [Marinobacterium aestuarii]ANG63714.1 transcriptional regulator [Marinobacterium aestuarii]
MNIRHHLDDATLLVYAAGSLSEGMSLLVASHIDRCAHCQVRVRQAEAVGGALLEELTPVALAPDALDQVLALLETDAGVPQARTPRPAVLDADIPAPLAQYLKKPLDELDWRTLVPGVRQLDLRLGGPGATRLLRIAPGLSVPHHSHRGNELTLILRGSYSDELGRFQAGDVADLDEQISHQPISDSGEDCICLIATDAPLRFSGLMGRLVQPFIGL